MHFPNKAWQEEIHGRAGSQRRVLRSASQAYQNYVRTLLTRNNTITGVLYKDDPTIMAVELSTKPHTRCRTAFREGDAWMI